MLLAAEIKDLPICFPAVSDPEYPHGFFGLIDLIDDSIGSDPDPPIILRAGELATPWRSWVLGQRTNTRDDPMESFRREPPQIPFRCPFEVDLIHSGGTPPRTRLVV
jgi:hypothetical protein